jgi:putative ABC transport system permease protein
MFDDLRYALRRLGRTPGFTVIAILTLALGIGACTAVFAIEQALAVRPDRFLNLDHVFALRFASTRPTRFPRQTPEAYVTMADVEALNRSPPDPIRQVAAESWPVTVIARAPDRAEVVAAEGVTGNYADLFGLRTEAGRFITPQDDVAGAARVAVLSDRAWRAWFGGDRTIVGRASLDLSEPDNARLPTHPQRRRFTVVGVAPRGFRGQLGTDVWIAQHVRPDLEPARQTPPAPVTAMFAFANVAPGVPPAAITAAVRASIAAAHPDFATRVVPAASFLSPPTQRSTMVGILSLAVFILFAACANLANMLYARGTGRAGEVAVRLSLGASRGRVFRLFAAETTILAAVSAAAGFALALGGIRLFAAAVPSLGSSATTGPRAAAGLWPSDLMALSPASHVFVYALAAAAIAALAVGVATAWRASRAEPARTLASAGIQAGITTRGRRTRLALVAVQVTAAVLVVIGGGLYAESYRQTLDRHINFETPPLTAAEINLNYHGYDDARGRAFYERLVQAAAALPGVQHAAIAEGIPGAGSWLPDLTYLVAQDRSVHVPGVVSPRVSGFVASVSPGFFDTLGLRIVRGRPLWPSDEENSRPVAVVTASAAAALWPGADPIGRPMAIGGQRTILTVVGVVSDPVTSSSATTHVNPANDAFVPLEQVYRPDMFVVVRSEAPGGMTDALRAAVRRLDDNVAVLQAGTVDDSILAWVGPLRAAALLMGALGLIGLGIATLGVYGVLAHLVARRRREFGIRFALGATPGRVVRMVLDQALSMLLVGLLPGVLVASLGTNVVAHWLPGVTPNGVAMWVAAPLAVLAIGLAAAYVPARRAAGVDPNVALREL